MSDEREIDFEQPEDDGAWHYYEETQRQWEEWFEEYEKNFRFVNPLMNKKAIDG